MIASSDWVDGTIPVKTAYGSDPNKTVLSIYVRGMVCSHVSPTTLDAGVLRLFKKNRDPSD